MPYSDIGQAFSDIGRTVASTIAEKRKKDREKEEKMRLARMLQMFGASPMAVSGVEQGLDASTMMGLDDDVEKREKEKDKARAEAQARDAETKEFDARMGQFGAQYPLSPEQEAAKSAYPTRTPEQRDSFFGDMAKMRQKSQANQLLGELERDPSRQLSPTEIEALYPNDPGKRIAYTGRPYAELKKSELPKPEKPEEGAKPSYLQSQVITQLRQEGFKDGTPEFTAEFLKRVRGGGGGELPSTATQQQQVQQFYMMLKNLDNQRVSRAGSTLDSSGQIVSASPTADSTLMRQAVGLSQQMTGAKQSVTKDYTEESAAIDDRMQLIEDAIRELDEELKR